MIDKRNHHLFQPLLYQVATTLLRPRKLWPIRHLLRKRKDVTTLLATVSGVDRVPASGCCSTMAAGSPRHARAGHGRAPRTCGHDEWEPLRPG
jgi:NADH dehydrogenase